MQTVKPVSSSRENFPLYVTRNSGFRLHQATLVILVMIGFFAAISLSWLFGNNHVTELFASLQLVQENPPSWLIPPQLGNKYYLLVPTLVLFFFGARDYESFPYTSNLVTPNSCFNFIDFTRSLSTMASIIYP